MLEDILLGIIDAFLLRKTMQFCSGVDSRSTDQGYPTLAANRPHRIFSKAVVVDRVDGGRSWGESCPFLPLSCVPAAVLWARFSDGPDQLHARQKGFEACQWR